jgi:hypothetical protein
MDIKLFRILSIIDLIGSYIEVLLLSIYAPQQIILYCLLRSIIFGRFNDCFEFSIGTILCDRFLIKLCPINPLEPVIIVL